MTADETLVNPALPGEPTAVQVFRASIAAVIGKESKWRMRGRRAFVILAVYVALLGLFELFVAKLLYDQAAMQVTLDGDFVANPDGFAAGSVASGIGQVLFGAVISLQMLLVMFVAPALSSGAVSMEREKQTLELLITTPVSTLGMIVGKLFASLAYVFLLIAASVPLMALVFVFGGVAPEDVVRAYVLLCAVAIGIGSIGLFMSALTKRTQVATVLSLLVVLVLTIGSLIAHTYIQTTSQRFDRGEFRPGRAPEALLLLNPVVAVVDIGCTAIPENGFTCSYIGTVTSPDAQFDFTNAPRDAFWPRTSIAFLLLALILTLVTTQLIAPSRRVRRRRTLMVPSKPSAT
jgi:ABC-type transport system involved in multi-copper enzyme maturation permease subunit